MISVIMSVYNEKKEWLQLSIESILNQTYTNFEFIIILDNPKNETLKKLILKFQEKDKRIKFYINDSNIGLTRSLNKALTYAKGEYIARMDADDISISTRLEKQLNYIKQTDIDILGTNVIKFDDKNNEEFSNFFLKDIDIKQNIFKKNMIAHPTWLVKKEVYKCLNGYREISVNEKLPEIYPISLIRVNKPYIPYPYNYPIKNLRGILLFENKPVGHWNAFVKCMIDNKWRKFNDREVTIIENIKDVENREEAVILCYERKI